MKRTIFLTSIILLCAMISNAQFNNIINYSYRNGSLPDSLVQGIYAPDSNELWVITDEGLSHLKNKKWTNYNDTNSEILCSHLIRDIIADNNSNIWVATLCGLYKFDKGHFIMYSTLNSNITCNQLIRLAIDENNIVWIATSKCGLIKFDGSNFTNYAKKNSSILSDTLGDIYIKNGIKYLVYNDGLIQFDGINWKNINFKDYINEDHWIWRSIVDNNDNIFFSGWNTGIYQYNGLKMIKYFDPEAENPDRRFYSFISIYNDTIFLNFQYRGLATIINDKIIFFDSINNLLPNLKYSSCQTMDKYGNLYIGTSVNGVYKLNKKVIYTSIMPEININDKSSFTINPNPTSDKTMIYKNGNIKIRYISIIDMQGNEKKIITETELNNVSIISMSDQAKGIYFIKILTEKNNTFFYKLIKL